MKKPANNIQAMVLNHEFKYPVSTNYKKLKEGNQCRLDHLLLWWDEETLLYEAKKLKLAVDPLIYIYEEGAYDTRTGKWYTVMNVLKKLYHFSDEQAHYIVDYYIHNVSKKEIENYANEHYHTSNLLPKLKHSLNRIVKVNQFKCPWKRSYAYKNTYGFLCSGKHIDKTIVDNFIAAGLLAFDENRQLHFLCCDGKDVASATVVSLNQNIDIEQHYFQKRNVGFQYLPWKELIDHIYVFDSCIELLSYLNLAKLHLVPSLQQRSAYIVLPEGNTRCLDFFLKEHPANHVFCCLENYFNDDPTVAKIKAIEGITMDDMRYILTDFSKEHEKDVNTWNQMLCHYHTYLKPPAPSSIFGNVRVQVDIEKHKKGDLQK